MDLGSEYKTLLESKRFSVKAPGRVNLLGEHVDYNGGIVLPVAIDRYVTIRAQVLSEPIISLEAHDLNLSVDIPIERIEEKCDENGNSLPGYALYPAGVAWALNKRGLQVNGIAATYSSNIPIGAGLSSSAAIEVGFARLWQNIGQWDINLMELVQLCQQAENDYVGVKSGLMDQFASAFGKQGYVLFFDTRSLERDFIPLPSDVAIVIADSGVRHSLASSSYNERRMDCDDGVKILQRFIPGVQSLCDVTIDQYGTYAHHLTPRQQKRVRYVVEEMDRVFQAINFLRKGEVTAFGKLMFECHNGLRDLYEVSCPELDMLVEIASELEGCYGARLTGAGFGGCTVNLVNDRYVETFIASMKKKFRHQTGESIDIYSCHASDGVQIIE
jgi:galactokinase